MPRSGIAHECFEAFDADLTLAQWLVAIDPRPQSFEGIIEVERIQMLQTNGSIELFQGGVNTRTAGKVVARRKRVAGVDTNTYGEGHL